MATTIAVNVPPYGGEYELDINSRTFSTFEWRVIKRVSGYLPLTIAEGWEGGDPDLVLAMALIAMLRAGKIEKREVYNVGEIIEDAEVDGTAIAVKLDEEAEAGDADPQQSSSPDGEKPSSGDASAESSDVSPESESQSTSGIRVLDSGSTSDPVTLAK